MEVEELDVMETIEVTGSYRIVSFEIVRTEEIILESDDEHA